MFLFKQKYRKVPLLSKCFSAHILKLMILQ